MKYIFLIILIILSIFLYHNNSLPKVEAFDTNITEGIEMEVDENIKQQWERLFNYYEDNLTKKCKGASEEKIVEVEREFKVKLPKAFADSFRICDERYIFNTSEKKGWFGEHEHYSLSKTYYEYYNLIEINKDMRVYDEKWKDEWIAFYDYETWFYAIIDTKTGKIYLESSEGGNKIVWANSYEEWLKMVVDEVVKYGELRLDTIQKLLSIE